MPHPCLSRDSRLSSERPPGRWSPSASRPPSGGCPEDPDEPVALQVHDSPSGGISTVLTLTFPFPSGLTRRLPFSLASQLVSRRPSGSSGWRTSCPESTHRGSKPRSLAFWSMSRKCSFPALRGVCRRPSGSQGIGGAPVGPEQRYEADSLDQPLVLPAPVVGHEFHLGGVRLVQGGVVQHEHPLVRPDEAPNLLVWGLSAQESGEGVVGGWALALGLAPRRLGAREDPLGGDQEVDVVQVVTLRWIHSASIQTSVTLNSRHQDLNQLRNSCIY